MKKQVQIKTLQIEGQDVSATGEQTILQVALENNIQIPRLCYVEGLSAVGACRLCMVEVKGGNRLLPACVTRVAEGMEVTVFSERLNAYRKLVLEMMFSERNHICSVCVVNGHCELQTLAMKHGVTHITVPYLHPRVAVDASHERFTLDHNRCVLCARCVRVCAEIEGAHTWDFKGRGIETRVISDMNEAWGDSETCTSCGKCVHVCPTGALFEKGKSVAEMSKRKQYLPYLTMMRDEAKA
jgi:bidirectional [NiFe] hydrogenase diaphorase subunit